MDRTGLSKLTQGGLLKRIAELERALVFSASVLQEVIDREAEKILCDGARISLREIAALMPEKPEPK